MYNPTHISRYDKSTLQNKRSEVLEVNNKVIIYKLSTLIVGCILVLIYYFE